MLPLFSSSMQAPVKGILQKVHEKTVSIEPEETIELNTNDISSLENDERKRIS